MNVESGEYVTMSGGTKLTRHLLEDTFDSEVRDDAYDLGFNQDGPANYDLEDHVITGMRIDEFGDLWLDWDATFQVDNG